MESQLPKQFTWKEFVKILRALDYELYERKRGSARTFRNTSGRDPEFVTFHEPHKPKHLKRGTLREYLRKLKVTREEFFRFLAN